MVWLLQTLTALDANVPDGASFPISIIREEIDIAYLKDKELGQQILAMFKALKAVRGFSNIRFGACRVVVKRILWLFPLVSQLI